MIFLGFLLNQHELDQIHMKKFLDIATKRAKKGSGYLVLMELRSGRTQDLADISRMLGLAADAEIQRTREIVAKYQPDDIEDLESLINLGRLEVSI